MKPELLTIVKDPPKTQALGSWYEAYEEANLHNPQEVYGLRVLVGSAVCESLLEGEVTLDYVSRARLTRTQLSGLEDVATLAHRAHGITMIPAPQALEGEKQFNFNKIVGDEIWPRTILGIVRAIAYVGAGKHPDTTDEEWFNLPAREKKALGSEMRVRETYISTSPAHALSYQIRREDADQESGYTYPYIIAFQNDPNFLNALSTTFQMFIAARDALRSPEGLSWATSRRKKFAEGDNSKDPLNIGEYATGLVKLMKGRLDDLTRKGIVTEDQVICFLDAVTTRGLWLLSNLDKKWGVPELREWRQAEQQDY